MNLSFGIPLDKTVKAIAVFEVIWLLLKVGVLLIFIISSDDVYRFETAGIVGLVIASVVIVSIGFALSYVLFTGVIKRSVTRLNIWLVFSWIGFVLCLISFIQGCVEAYVIPFGDVSVRLEGILFVLIPLVVTGWCIAVVHEFRRQLKNKINVKYSPACHDSNSIDVDII